MSLLLHKLTFAPQVLSFCSIVEAARALESLTQCLYVRLQVPAAQALCSSRQRVHRLRVTLDAQYFNRAR